jgi:C-terminal processing protease CtpA/Prc
MMSRKTWFTALVLGSALMLTQLHAAVAMNPRNSKLTTMQKLQEQMTILTEKIKADDEQKQKLIAEASLEKLDSFIDPITQYLDWSEPSSYDQSITMSLRQQYYRDAKGHDVLKYKTNPILANEEIFVTIMGILKKQEEKIEALEEIVMQNL